MKKQATYGDYVITINDDSSVSVTYQNEECSNAKKALREVSENAGFAFDAGWNTRQFGSKLVDFLQSQGGATEKKEDTANKVTSKKSHVVVTLDIPEYEYMAFDSEGDMVGCESHCFNGDDGFENLQVIVDDVPLDEDLVENFIYKYSGDYETFNLEWDGDEEVASVGFYDNETHRTWEFDIEDFDFNKLVFYYKGYDLKLEVADYNVESHRLVLKYDGKEVDENYDAYECDNGELTVIWSKEDTAESDSNEQCVDDIEKKESSSFKFDVLYEISNDGIVLMEQDGKLGAINIVGKEILSPRYDNVKLFENEFVVLVQAEKPKASFFFSAEQQVPNKYIALDKRGEELCSFEHYIGDIREGKARTWRKDNGGYINTSDWTEIVSIERYDMNEAFSEGMAAVKRDGKWGYIDATGIEVIPLQYDSADWFSEGLASVKLNGKWGFIDKNGKVVIPFKYDSCYSFNTGYTLVKLDGKYGFISNDGTELTPFIYDDGYQPQNGLCQVSKDGKWGLVNNRGEEVIPLKYHWAHPIGGNLISIQDKNGKWGIINFQQELVVSPIYGEISDFSDGLSAVEFDGKWGFINSDGEVVIPYKYELTRKFHLGVAPVKLNGKWGLIDVNDNIIV